MTPTPVGPSILRAEGYRGYRWRNGLGSATEIAAEATPHGSAPGWTLSIATVEADVAFSAFPGVDRWLMALSSGGLGLVHEGERRLLGRWEVLAFSGEAAVESVGVVEPTLDLNLMIPRERFQGLLVAQTFTDRTLVSSAPLATTFVVVLKGQLSSTAGAVGHLDSFRLDGGVSAELEGDATVAVATIAPRP